MTKATKKNGEPSMADVTETPEKIETADMAEAIEADEMTEAPSAVEGTVEPEVGAEAGEEAQDAKSAKGAKCAKGAKGTKSAKSDKSAKSAEGAGSSKAAKSGKQARSTKKKKRDNRSGLSKLRSYMPVIVVVVCAVAFVAKVPLGNISTFGWEAISAICPMGALSVFLASKTFVPRVIISIVVAFTLILLFGRAFCSWICTVPLVQRMLNIRSISKEDQRKEEKDRERKERRKNRGKRKAAGTAATAAADAAVADGVVADAAVAGMGAGVAEAGAAVASIDSAPVPAVAGGAVVAASSALSEAERADIAREMSQIAGAASGCGLHRARKLDSRHAVLGGALLSAAVFGFPVFCLICPIGLSFATIFLVLRLFTGQVSLALVIVPALLIAELLIFRKWCYKICPVSALMSLVGHGNKTFVPHVDKDKCLETSKGRHCSLCNTVCPEGINLHDLAAGEYGMNECIKCRRCVDACPTKAISMPVLPPKE